MEKLPRAVTESTFAAHKMSGAPVFQWYVTNLVESVVFEPFMGFVILANCICIGIEVEMCPPSDSIRFTPKIGGKESAGCPEGLKNAWEHIFTLIFVLEFLLRTQAHGLAYYTASAQNMADAALVWVTGVLMTWIIQPLQWNVGPLRNLTVLRAFRLIRIARVVRSLPQFKEMWLLIRGLMESGRTLFWTAVVIAFVNYIFGIVFMFIATDRDLYVTKKSDLDACTAGDDCSELTEEIEQIMKYFGSLGGAMYTLIQIMGGDSWSENIVRPISRIFPEVQYVFILYVAVSCYVLVNLVTAVIVDNALAITKEDDETKLREKRDAEKKTCDELRSLFETLDADGSGELSAEELDESFEDSTVQTKFELLDLSKEKVKDLFDLLDITNDGSLSLEEFVEGLTKVKNEVKSWDLLVINTCVQRISINLEKFMSRVEGKLFGHPVSKPATGPARRASVRVSQLPMEGSLDGALIPGQLMLSPMMQPPTPPAVPAPFVAPGAPGTGVGSGGGTGAADMQSAAGDSKLDTSSAAIVSRIERIETKQNELRTDVMSVAAEVKDLTTLVSALRGDVLGARQDQERERAELVRLFKTSLAALAGSSAGSTLSKIASTGGRQQSVGGPAPASRGTVAVARPSSRRAVSAAGSTKPPPPPGAALPVALGETVPTQVSASATASPNQNARRTRAAMRPEDSPGVALAAVQAEEEALAME